MKIKYSMRRLFGTAGLGLVLAGRLMAADMTAFNLVKEGNKSVGEHAKDRVVQIRSEKSVGSLTPNIWCIVYYDQHASMKSVEVKFVGEKVVSVKRPMRLLEAVTDKDNELDAKKLKVDSDKALRIALKEKVLENLTIKASQMKLEAYENQPVWKIKLWAAKLKNPGKEAEIGEIFVAADDGKVLKIDVKPGKVD